MGSVGFPASEQFFVPKTLPHQEHFTISFMIYLLSKRKKPLSLTVEKSESGAQIVVNG